MRVPRIALRRAARWCTLAALAAIPVVACSAKQEPAKGEIIVSFQTDMSVPENVDSIRVQVLQNGIARYNVLHSVGPSPELVPLPATLAIIAGETNAPVVIRVIGFSKGAARVLRSATVTVPTARIAHLPMPLAWLCWDSALVENKPPVGSDLPEDFTDFCGDGQTCIAGECVDQQVDANTLSSYEAKLVFGGAPGPGSGGLCADVLGCFDQGAEVPVQASPPSGPVTQCTIQLPPGASAENLNVGLVLPKSTGKGICGPGHCIVALDNDPILGWEIAGNEVMLPPNVCTRLNETDPAKRVDAVAVTVACPSKTAAIPICGPWSSVSGTLPTDGGAPQKLDGGTETDSGADASLDGGTDASGDASPPDGSSDAAILPSSSQIGLACTTDSECDGGKLVCVKQAGGLASGAVGPAGGVCSWPCTVAADNCGKIETGAVCRELTPGQGYCVEGCDPSKSFFDPDAGATVPQCSGRLDMACTTGGNGPGCVPRCANDNACTQGGASAGAQKYCHLLTGLCHSAQEAAGNVGAACSGGEAGTCTSSNCQSFPDGDAGTADTCTAECILQDSVLGGLTCGWDGAPQTIPNSACVWPANKNATLPGSAGQCLRLCGCSAVQYSCEDNPGFVCVDFQSATWLDAGYRAFLAATGAEGFCAPPVGPNGESVTWGLGC